MAERARIRSEHGTADGHIVQRSPFLHEERICKPSCRSRACNTTAACVTKVFALVGIKLLAYDAETLDLLVL